MTDLRQTEPQDVIAAAWADERMEGKDTDYLFADVLAEKFQIFFDEEKALLEEQTKVAVQSRWVAKQLWKFLPEHIRCQSILQDLLYHNGWLQ